MKVFTNENNSLVLKILISAEISKKRIDVEIVSIDDKRFQTPKKLPVLSLDSGLHLFSNNAACLYLLPPQSQHYTDVEKWLKWEAVELMPYLVLIGGKPDPSESIKKLLVHLESSLQGKSYLVSQSMTVADISIWSTLYPIYTEEKLRVQFLSDKTNIKLWLKTLESTPQFTEVLQRLKIKKGQAALQSVVASCWYPVQATVNQISQEKANNSPTSDEPKVITLTEEDLKAATQAWESGLKSRPKPKLGVKPVLPIPNEKNILITSALPYVNNVPHLGNIIGCVLSADVFARYCRLRNWNTLFVCGTDEYGTATETKALEEKLTPQQICDKYFSIHSEIYEWFSIQFDHFGRTTAPNQTKVVQDMFKVVHANGFTTTASMDQLLCENCDRYLADRFVEGICPKCKFEDARGDQCDGCGHLINAIELIKPRCKVCRSTPVVRQSQQLFLDLPKVEAQLAKWMETSSEGWTHNARVISKSWLKEGLKPRCITRDLKWGIPVPLKGFESKVFYVWFDAPIGYMSMTKTYTDDWLKWWTPDPKTKVSLYQFMAKDNVPFHSIMFPATLFASQGNYTLVNHLMATEYLNYEDGKFSKSRGVGVFGNDAKDTNIPSDIFRFYLLYIRPESQDSSFSWLDLATKNNTELLNNLGNFVNRALMFTEKFFDSLIMPIVIGTEERQLLGLVSHELKGYNASLSKAKLRDGIRYILNISRHGNVYMQSNQPWVLVKGSKEEKEKAGTVVSFCCNMVALLTVLLQPYMPQTSKIMAEQLNLHSDCFVITELFVPVLPTGHKIGKPSPLFTKIEQSVVEALKEKYAGKQKPESPEKSAKPLLEENKKSDAEGDTSSVAELEEAVAKQGEKVRMLKTGGAEKSVWQPEVELLLQLKKKLAAAQGLPTETPSSGRKKKSKK